MRRPPITAETTAYQRCGQAGNPRCRKDKHHCNISKRRPSPLEKRPARTTANGRCQRYRWPSATVRTRDVCPPSGQQLPAVADRMTPVPRHQDGSRQLLSVQLPPAEVVLQPGQGPAAVVRMTDVQCCDQDGGRPITAPTATGVPAPYHHIPAVAVESMSSSVTGKIPVRCCYRDNHSSSPPEQPPLNCCQDKGRPPPLG